MTPEDQGRALALARQTISAVLVTGEAPDIPPLDSADPLAQPGACFVTLTQAGTLRGCIGSLEAHRALAADIIANAFAAAFQDPRFPPLSSTEWPHTQLSLSVLGARHPLERGNRQQLLAQITPGRDGLVIEGSEGQRATFLPSVWSQLPDAEDFLDHLKAKAGLAANYDERQLRAWRYVTESFGDGAE